MKVFDVPPDATPTPAPVPLPAPTACGVLGDACSGSCAPTVHGDLCFPACTSDAECRPNDGVFCDPQWHACMIPNSAALVPKQCPAPVVRDNEFAASVAWSSDKPAGTYQNAPAAVLTADGGVTAMFTTRGRLDQTALQVVHVDGKGQRVEGVGPTTVQRADEPHLVRDRKGTLYAAWHAGDSETEQIGFATSSDGGVSWSSTTRVDDPADCPANEMCLGSPLVMLGGAKEMLYVAYGTKDGGLRVRASKDHGSMWSSPVTALVGSNGSGSVGSDGTLHLVTLNGSAHGAFGSAQHAIEYTSSLDGTTFKPPVTVSGRDEILPFYFARPAIAVDTRRKLVYIAYVRGGRDAVWDTVLATSKDGGVKWSRQVIDASACAIHMVPTLALDDVTGNLHIAYYDNVGAAGRFVHARCAPGGVKCQVVGAINSEPFAALTTGRQSATWIGESAALLVDGKRKKLHAVWTQPVGDPAIARIMASDGALK